MAPGRWRAGARAHVVLFSLSVALVALSLSGCRNKKEEARQKAELSKSLEQFQAQLGELQKQASGLRARFDKLPEDLPGIGPVRDDLHAVEEGLGVDDGRAKWLSGELDKAFTSGKKEEIEAVKNAIPQDSSGITQVMVRVAHQLAPLERLAAQRRFFESLDAAKAQKEAEEEARKARPPKAR
jgi:hypothetical protein